MCSSALLQALVGLGNPGPEYLDSRHNLGFLVLDRLARREGVRFRRQGPVEIGAWRPVGLGREVLLAKPLTYMNRSGTAVRYLSDRHRLAGEQFLVIVDDLDLPFGRLRLRARGGAGTHNGLRSIREALGNEDFGRLRVGMGPAPAEADLSEWVLEGFSPEEIQGLPAVLDRAADCLEEAVRQGLRPAMNRYNVVIE